MELLEEHSAMIGWLRRYVDGFRTDGRLHPMMATKWAHTARVGRLCRDLAAELAWTVEERSAAEAAGWLHDVGRFSQWAEHRTYNDAASINHATRGHEVLSAGCAGELAMAPRAADILQSVRCHNMREVPTELPLSCLPLVRIVRDADKLDIYEVVLDYQQQGRLGELLPRLAEHGPINPVLLEEIERTGRSTYANARNLSDFLVILASWVYDLNYAPSLRRVRERAVLGRLGGYLSHDPATAALLARAHSHVASAESRTDTRP